MTEMLEEGEYGQVLRALQFLQEKVNQVERFSGFIFQHGKEFSQVIKLAVDNARGKQFRSEDRVELDFLTQLLNVFLSMDYREATKDHFEVVLDSFWMVFREDDLDIYSKEGSHFLLLSLNIVMKMLQTETNAVFTSLKEVGLGTKIAYILDSPLSHSIPPLTSILMHVV